MEEREARESWQLHFEATKEQFATPEISLGPWTSYSLMTDPKHMVFVLSRYKFCAKLLAGRKSVLEVGCGDGFGVPVVAQAVDQLTCIDWENRNIDGNRRRLPMLRNVRFDCVDTLTEPLSGPFDAVFSIDVIEHVEPKYEHRFVSNMLSGLDTDGIMIMGTPNATAEAHASVHSDHQHINLKTAEQLKSLSDQFFESSFVFGMNDEVVHTGFFPMAQYLFVLGVGRK